MGRVRLRTEKELAPVRQARWNGATLQDVGHMLGCKPDHARKLCRKYGIEMSPIAKAAVYRENGAKSCKQPRRPRQMRQQPLVFVGRTAADSGRDNGGALPAGSQTTWSLISAAPWPCYEPLQDDAHG